MGEEYMKTYRIENLTQGETATILAALLSVRKVVFETKSPEHIADYTNAFAKALSPVVVDEATSLS